MTLFRKITGLFANPPSLREASAEESRGPGGGDMEQRSLPAHVAGWLSGVNGEATRLSDPYRLSPWVGSAIRHITRPISQVGLKFSVTDKTGEVELDDPVLNAFWQRPMKGMSATSRASLVDFVEATVGWLCLKGEFFWILDDTWLTRSPGKSPLIVARPDQMRPILEGGEVVGWRHTGADGRSNALIPEQVICSKFWNPSDDFRGGAPMTSAKMAAEADYAAARFWKSLAEANGDLGETVIAPNGITPEQEEQLKMTLRRKRAAAKAGRYEPLFLVGDLKTEAPNIQSPDASAVTQRLQNRHEVYIAFGVPPSFAEVTASYSIGSASDRYRLIEESCMPIAKKISEAIEVVSQRLTGRVVSAKFDWDEHSTMQQVRSERMETGRKMHERGVPWNVVSDHLNLNLKPFAGWDKAWLPFNLQEVDAPQAAPVVVEPPPVDPGVKVFAELEELLRGCPAHTPQAAAPTGKTRAAANNKRWEKLMQTRAPYVKRMRVIVDRALFEARRETLANIAAAEAAERAVRSGAFDFIFDLSRFLELLIEPLFKVVVGSYDEAGAEVLRDEIGSDEPFIPADENGMARLRARKNYIKDAGTDVWEEIRNSLEEGIASGESYKKLAERVRGEFNGMSKERSMRIAVTETSIAFESGRHDAMIQAGAEWKEWLSSGDERVRDTHRALDGTRMPMDEPFLVGGAPMMFPCDPNGPAAEVINCRCVHGPVDGPDGQDDIVGNDPDSEIPF